MKLEDLRSNIAIVPQDCVLFNDTIMYNIAYGGVRDPNFKAAAEGEEEENKLIETITPSS
jgi:ABC-type transport system involved in Fe-S cluster assembly fused permease/ATPase subunit